ncbi:MAG TPA: aldehyde reductase [Steroidobacteraceae bacterium]
MSAVLVTGGSGFIATHCILQLLAAGHEVRTTVRNKSREATVRALLKVGGANPGAALNVVVADLEKDDGWTAAVSGCAYVLHVASPFPSHVPRDENELIRPAREGTLRVLRASRTAGVKRLVLTSSFAAVGYGHPPQSAPFDESSWSNVSGPGITAYVKSKTLAERAAWDFMHREGGSLELSVVNPVGVFGPALGADTSTSVYVIRRMMEGSVPGMPNIAFGVVDVRDVADLHLRAMTEDAAKGERFLAIGDDAMAMIDIARLLKVRLGDKARKVPARKIPDWLVRLVALFDKTAGQIVPELGKVKNATHAKATRLLGWQPRSNEEALLATAESLLRLNIVD